jgi:hypothetical protein
MAKSAMEIGAGSTLVTYAGICDDDNIQMRSDPYFHVYNLNEFQENYFQSNVQIMDDVNMQTCGTRTEITNERPTANVPATCAIPKSTPFFLQGSGTDPNAADVLAYTWEPCPRRSLPSRSDSQPLSSSGLPPRQSPPSRQPAAPRPT